MFHIRRLVKLCLRADILVLAASMASMSPAMAEMLIERGDTVVVTVVEAPKLGGERKVDAEGRIMVPQIGGIAVAGLGLDAARARVEAELIKRDILKSPTVLVEMAKYRPVYIGGKVRRPGAIDYEPGITVRHALILAGGAGSAEDTAKASVDVPDLRAKWQTSSFQLLQVNSRIARLNAELTRNQAENKDVSSPSVPAADSNALVSLDQNILKDRIDTWSESQVHLRDQIALFDLEIDVLGQQAALQKNERDLIADQVNTAKTLVDKGLSPLSRLQELQHTQSRAQQDLLENQAFAARARQARANVDYEIKTADITWRTDIRQQLREAMIDRTKLKAEIDALSTQILNAGETLSQSQADTAQYQTIVIYRTVDGREQSITAQMNTEVEPGDIVDVSFSKGAG